MTTFAPLRQCTTLTAKSDFAFRSGSTKRTIQVRKGDSFWVTSCATTQARYLAGQSVSIARASQPLHYDYIFAREMLSTLFDIGEA